MVYEQPYTLTVMLDPLDDVFAVDLSISYSSTAISVSDHNPGIPGIQIMPGACPAPDFAVLNQVNSGLIRYAVTQLAPRPSCSGGVIAQIELSCTGQVGQSVMIFTSAQIANPEGFLLEIDTAGSSITCTPARAAHKQKFSASMR